ncbi:MAG: alpha-glucan family phosphorylase, partial [Deltaproteobacteria bacterium]
PVAWVVEDYLREMPQRTAVVVEGRTVQIRCWKYEIVGVTGYRVPAYLLDACLPENDERDRALTDSLYGGDQTYRFCQEIVLGIGGVRMLRALGYDRIERFHMNEGHASLLTVELMEEEARRAGRRQISRDDIEAVRRKCVFTTHTPVAAGHDQFSMDLVQRVLGPREVLLDMKDVLCVDVLGRVIRSHRSFQEMQDIFGGENNLNLTYLALNLSRYVNGVAKKHGEISRLLFAEYEIDAITNGVHAATWTSPPFQKLYDQHISGWRQDNFSLRSALSLPRSQVWQAHAEMKRRLVQHVNHETNAGMDVDVLTLGFARRATAYKRWDLIFQNLDRLRAIAARSGGIQLVFAGKAHPHDQRGKELIRSVLRVRDALHPHIKVAYLTNYNMALAKLITAGVDVWLNTPQPPLEASGTSGMKAAMNGVPSLSVLDGWWIEGHIEGVTGWSIGAVGKGAAADRGADAAALYDKLEQAVLPLFYRNQDGFVDVMLHTIALNASFFNTQRMLQQYVLNAYYR